MHIKPVRCQNQHCLHFITFSCYRRIPLLETSAAKETFERELERVRAWYGCYITGYVVMPEHVHLADQRTRTLEIIRDDTDAQADHVTEAASETASALMAGPLLRFSSMERGEAHREAALHPSQSGKARTGGKAKGLEMEQLCSLCNGGKADCRDRIALDRSETRTTGCRAPGQSPPSRQERGKGGATS